MLLLMNIATCTSVGWVIVHHEYLRLFDRVYIMTNYVMLLNPLMHTLIRTSEPTGSAFTNMAACDDEQVCLCCQLHA